MSGALGLLIGVAVLAFPSAVWSEEGQRGSIPPGASRDGSAPSDGALKGGAILPGETGGMPDAHAEREKRERRCKQLAGTLREDCLRQGREAAAGASGEASDARTPKAERAD
jgi:hypothetical protein